MGNWVQAQRKRNSKLSPEQRKALDDIGFDWEPLMTAWNEMYTKLKEYKKKHGDCNVPTGYLADKPLANWAIRQRQSNSKLSPEQRKALDDIGFDWKPLTDDSLE
jgi:transposase